MTCTFFIFLLKFTVRWQEDKKAKVEKKLEDAARREKEKIRRERQKLMDFRKQRESYIKAVENNMKLVKEVSDAFILKIGSHSKYAV